jgi:integrase
MASIIQVKGKWRAQVRKRGVSMAQTFRTKGEANRWAALIERDIEDRRVGKPTRHTWRDAVERYTQEVSAYKVSAATEAKRLKALLRVDFVDWPLVDIGSDDWVRWRNGRKVKPSSINREFHIIRHVYRYATREWGWIPLNPMDRIKDLKEPPHRRLVWNDGQVQEMVEALGQDAATVRGRVALAFLFALETGMRAGEICGLQRRDVAGPVAHLHRTKNGLPRAVPLAPRALQIIEPLGDALFDLTPTRLDAVFRKYKPEHLRHLTFHDARHTAATRLGSSGKWNALEMCLAFGWEDPKQAMTYFNATAESLALKLAASPAP